MNKKILKDLYELEDAKGLFEMNRKYNGGNFFEYKINILKNENE